MKRRWVLLVITFNLIGLTALVFRYPHLMVAPGPLIPAHSSIEANCFACHVPLRGPVDERCLACHKVEDIGLRRTTGVPIVRATLTAPFHQSLVSQNCLACHTSHMNPAWKPRSRPSFSHTLLSTKIRDDCALCHTAPATVVHMGVTTQCLQCHSRDSWKSASFDHTKFFVLDQNHNVACNICHTTTDRKQYTCYGCHTHTEANIRDKHLHEGISNFTNCAACHRSAQGEGREGGEREGRERKDDN